MAEITYNPKSGIGHRLEGNKYIPTEKAVNPDTGQVYLYNGKEWKEVPSNLLKLEEKKEEAEVPTLTPPTPAETPPVPAETPPVPAETPAVTTEPPAVTTEPPAVTTEPPAVPAEPSAVPAEPPAVTTEPPADAGKDKVFGFAGKTIGDRFKELYEKVQNKTATLFEIAEYVRLFNSYSEYRSALVNAMAAKDVASTPIEIVKSLTTFTSPEAAKAIKESPIGEVTKKINEVLEPNLNDEEQLIRESIALLSIAGLGKKLFKDGLEYIAKKRGKEFSDKIKRRVALTGAGAGATQGIVQYTDFDKGEQALLVEFATNADMGLVESLPEPVVEAFKKFRVNPNDPARKQEFLKYIGAIADTAVGSALFSAIGYSGKKLFTKQNIARLNTATGKLLRPVKDIAAKLNTYAGRLLRSDANLPQPLADAARKRTRAAAGYEIEIKKQIKDLERSIKENDVDEDIVNEYINTGAKNRQPYMDRGVPESVLVQVDNIKKQIKDNEELINTQLGLTGKARIGVNRDQNGFYLSRTFESANNPKYYAEIKKALLDKSPDPVFLTKVENARAYLRNQGVNANDVDSVITSMVYRLSKEDRPLIDKIFNGTAQQAYRPATLKVLKRKQDLDQPILDLLGEIKSGKQNLATSLIQQNKLIAELKYLKDVEKFAKENIGKDVDLKGFFPRLPAVKTTFKTSDAPNIEFGLEQVAKDAIGKFGGDSRKILKDIYTSPYMGTAINQGLEVFNSSGKFRRAWVNVASLAQASQTLLDLPAYALNFIGGIQSLVANGHFLNPVAYKAAVKEIGTLANQLTLKNPKAVEKLAKLRSLGVIEQDVTGELIKAGAAQMQNAVGRVGRAYQKTMSKLGSLYGQPDAYLKLVAFESERSALKKIFKEGPSINNIMRNRNVNRREAKKIYDNDLDERAARYVRETMPTYGDAAPIARELSKTPIIGNYVLFPSEVIRNTKNILKASMRDITEGIKTKNPALIAHAARRFAGVGVAAGGWDMVANQNENAYQITEANKKFVNAVSPDWTKGSKQFYLQPFVKDNNQKIPRITTRYIGSTSADTFDLLKAPLRLLYAKLVTNGFVTDSEIDDAIGNATKGLISSYVSPKLLTEALVNVVTGTNLKTGKPIYDEAVGATTKDKIITAIKETGKFLGPGTITSVIQYVESLDSEKLLGLGQGQRASGFPLNSKDLKFHFKTGIRPVTLDVQKSMGYDMSSRLKAIAKTKDNFLAEVRKLPRREITNEDVDNLLKSYRDLQERKYRGMQKFTQRLNEFKNVSYYEIPKGKTEIDFDNKKILGPGGVLEAATDKFWYNPNDKSILPLVADTASNVKNGVFIPDNLIGDMSIFKALEDRQVRPEVSNRLQQGLIDIFSEYIQKPLVGVED